MDPTARVTDQQPILIVATDPKLTQRMGKDVQFQGYDVVIAKDGAAAISKVKAQSPAMVVIDRQIAELSGLQLCRQLRSSGAKMPLLLLMRSDQLADRIACLESGADDYILKPYQSEGLWQCMRLYLQTDRSSAQQELNFKDLKLDLATRTAYRASRLIELTMKEYELLKYLMEHPQEVLTREQILEKVWGVDFRGESNVIEVYIRYLRLKVQISPEKRLIHTVRGVGYVLRES